jgi:hypothetical protein
MINWWFVVLMMVCTDWAASTHRLGLDYRDLLDRPLWMFNSRCMAVFVPLAHFSGVSIAVYLTLGFFMLPWLTVLISAVVGLLTVGFVLAILLRPMNHSLRWMLALVLNACALVAFIRFH